MSIRFGAPFCALLIALPAHAEEEPQRPEVTVTAQKDQSVQVPASHASVDAATIATTVNAVNVEDTVKYLPGLIVRKRHVGDTQSPLATRTAGLGASARSLIYADGVLLSALIGNNNSNASPRWGLVSPQEIERIDVTYGPYSAAYPGNAIGAVVNITTRMPDRLEATVNVATSVQTFSQYGSGMTLPSRQAGATLGDRFGPLALFASVDHVVSNGQPLTYVTATRPAGASATGAPVTGAVNALNRTGGAIVVLGESGLEHQVQDRFKVKAALDLGSVRASYTGALFVNSTDAAAHTYLTDGASGLPAYAGNFNIDGRAYTVAPSAFSGGVYRSIARHWSHAASLAGGGKAVDWQLISTLYDYATDRQRIPTGALPGALGGGAGTITRLDGTGWRTLDGKVAWRASPAATISAGLHGDWFKLASNRYVTADWLNGGEGALNLQSAGRTRTLAVWAEGAWKPLPQLSLTLGGRYEAWRAYDGVNFSLTPAIYMQQPVRSADRFSPKAALAWTSGDGWTARLSVARAWRFPTVGELYQVVTTPVAAVPNPDLRPERALSSELALERVDVHGSLRLSLFGEGIADALISQTGALNGSATLATFVQNVDATRARGVEAAWVRSDLLPHLDVSGSVTFADARVTRDAAFRAAEGAQIPGVPRWKATLVTTWRAVDGVSLTVAGRYASRIYGTLDNSDPVGNTYQGFYRYLVADVRAQFRLGRQWQLGLGVDNIGNDRYFLFHPFPQRTFSVDLKWSL